jgi:hypothetical protein
VVVDYEAERPVQIVFNEFTQSRFSTYKAFGTADYIVAIR